MTKPFDINLDSIVEEALKGSALTKDVRKAVRLLPKAKPELNEAYVPQNKVYALATERLSEPAKQHHEQLYRSYAQNLTRISAEVDAAPKAEASASRSVYRSAKRDEAYNLNAVYLHELFFANCFDQSSELFMHMEAFVMLQRDWGAFDAWIDDFMACAMSARNGWAVCGYSMFLKKFTNVCVDGHDQGVLVGLMPILVVDMWEHSYVRDYGGDKRTYLNAVMQEINWEVVEDRMKRLNEARRMLG